MASDATRPDEEFEDTEFQGLLKDKLADFADTLGGREETIIRKRWLTEEPLTLRELGARFGVSRERARQVEKRLLDRLKKYLVDEFGSAVNVDLRHAG
jgi:RNA polymerase sigma-32 factor